MRAKHLLEIVNFVSLFVCLAVISSLLARGLLRKFWPVASFLVVRVLTHFMCMPPLFFAKELGLSRNIAYKIVFYSVWPSIILNTIIMVLIVYSVYSMVLAPFEPLKRLGTIMFRWIAAIGTAVSVGVAVGPHMLAHNYVINLVSQMQQAANVLTLCLLLFVCFSLRPLGLTYRSRYFGVCLGLGMMATAGLVEAAWYTVQQAQSVYSMMYFWNDLGIVFAMCVWGTYFILPEPQTRMVLLPTTSPFFFWNKVSAALDTTPGMVVITGFSPQSLAPAEMEALLSVSEKAEDKEPRLLQPLRAYGS